MRGDRTIWYLKAMFGERKANGYDEVIIFVERDNNILVTKRKSLTLSTFAAFDGCVFATFVLSN